MGTNCELRSKIVQKSLAPQIMAFKGQTLARPTFKTWFACLRITFLSRVRYFIHSVIHFQSLEICVKIVSKTLLWLRHWPHLQAMQATPLLTASHRILSSVARLWGMMRRISSKEKRRSQTKTKEDKFFPSATFSFQNFFWMIVGRLEILLKLFVFCSKEWR